MTIARPLGLALAGVLALIAAAPAAAARPRARGARRFDANKTFGVGIMVGAPTTISGRCFE